MSGIDDAVGARIAKGRRRRGWTQRDLSLAVGRSESWVSQVERGVLALDSVDTAEAIARALGLDVSHILGLVRLGRHELALPLLDAALEHLEPSMRRHRATAHADRADAHAAAGHHEAAVADAHASLTLLEEVHHAETLRRITVLHQTLRTSRTPASRSLAEHLIHARSTLTTRSPA